MFVDALYCTAIRQSCFHGAFVRLRGARSGTSRCDTLALFINKTYAVTRKTRIFLPRIERFSFCERKTFDTKDFLIRGGPLFASTA